MGFRTVRLQVKRGTFPGLDGENLGCVIRFNDDTLRTPAVPVTNAIAKWDCTFYLPFKEEGDLNVDVVSAKNNKTVCRAFCNIQDVVASPGAAICETIKASPLGGIRLGIECCPRPKGAEPLEFSGSDAEEDLSSFLPPQSFRSSATAGEIDNHGAAARGHANSGTGLKDVRYSTGTNNNNHNSNASLKQSKIRTAPLTPPTTPPMSSRAYRNSRIRDSQEDTPPSTDRQRRASRGGAMYQPYKRTATPIKNEGGKSDNPSTNTLQFPGYPQGGEAAAIAATGIGSLLFPNVQPNHSPAESLWGALINTEGPSSQNQQGNPIGVHTPRQNPASSASQQPGPKGTAESPALTTNSLWTQVIAQGPKEEDACNAGTHGPPAEEYLPEEPQQPPSEAGSDSPRWELERQRMSPTGHLRHHRKGHQWTTRAAYNAGGEWGAKRAPHGIALHLGRSPCPLMSGFEKFRSERQHPHPHPFQGDPPHNAAGPVRPPEFRSLYGPRPLQQPLVGLHLPPQSEFRPSFRS